ncbi:hypothetical protein RZS08_12260, partial [Arthrospira platensis SPKY1]|nr:hypothetical protein [Arthrospira platensis SPKY1]
DRDRPGCVRRLRQIAPVDDGVARPPVAQGQHAQPGVAVRLGQRRLSGRAQVDKDGIVRVRRRQAEPGKGDDDVGLVEGNVGRYQAGRLGENGATIGRAGGGAP